MDQHHDPDTDRDLDPVRARLQAQRPIPAPGFRGELRRRLMSANGAGASAPRRLRLQIAAYGGSGATMLAVAAVGLAGIGPFAS